MTISETDKIATIRRLYADDARDMPPARTLDDIPAFYECITAEWLTAVVRLRHPGATVTGFRLGERDSGTTNRRRIHLEYAGDDAARGYPASFFCKAAQDLPNRITMSAGSAMGETQFYREIRPILDVEAPVAYFSACDPESYRAIIVMADIAGSAEFCAYRTPVSRARAESQVALLARLHGAFYDGRGDRALLRGMDSFPDRFHRIDRFHGLADACGRGLIAAAEVMPRSLIARADAVWPLTLQAIDRLNAAPQTLTHGDVHLGNWYVLPGDNMGLADFQNLTTSHWSRDLAYTLATGLTIDDRRAWERDLIALYLDRMRESGGCAESFADAWRGYRRQMLSVLAWWTVTLTPAPTMAQDMQSRETTLCFLERIGQAIEDLETLDSF